MKKIIILGGGTAGWMSASLLNHAWRNQGVQVELIESPDIATVGVGEGSTPALKSFFDKLGVTEAEWMPSCNATFKCGISFDGWSGRPGFESYFHPFPSQIDDNTLPVFSRHIQSRRDRGNAWIKPDDFFLAALLARQNQAPKESENFPFELTYGYHFDAGLLADFLRQRAVAHGVVHRQARMTGVERAAQGDISVLRLEDGETVSADFFVDCSGFSGALIQQQLGVPFVSYRTNLFNDAAVALATSMEEQIPSETRSLALEHGWAWKIPLTNRYGNGYVYSSDYCSADQAEAELRKHLGLLDADVAARHLKMKVGRVERHWSHNCLAVGLAQGFIEPLEATALFLVQYTVENFILAFEKGWFTAANQQTFNDNINAQFEGVRDYIVCHYKTTGRKDTAYWRDNAANKNLSPSLQNMFQCWIAGHTLGEEVQRQGVGRAYTDVSWYCLLAGMGIFPPAETDVPGDERQQELAQVHEFLRRCSLNFPSHRNYLEQQARNT